MSAEFSQHGSLGGIGGDGRVEAGEVCFWGQVGREWEAGLVTGRYARSHPHLAAQLCTISRGGADLNTFIG